MPDDSDFTDKEYADVYAVDNIPDPEWYREKLRREFVEHDDDVAENILKINAITRDLMEGKVRVVHVDVTQEVIVEWLDRRYGPVRRTR